ncbi:hypothetical protein EDI_056520 [Entamoeba dispar SAW760]|uniref:Uncharacterized protein n=1 Tax=Entamoeba dispar (strain ATCC PRA-260 / SAW760) TaxID=370354 RepID=B0EMG9_ENTDS|nr:uncharacterized protein EDI_056520 [Entamoeba dispar SAW760]EDR24275.1 hypothetical protein EDI_056520 [Entamoeba dispar SAW760]|eukprot:EDR24275.1 hypothetical protein EDI_056520 [Entamoeba dispar SAW760]
MRMIYCLIIMLFVCFGEGKSLSRQSKRFANKVADEIIGVKVNINYVPKQKTRLFNFESCKNSTAAQCFLCKQKVVEDEDYCDNPIIPEQKCMCLAAHHQWRTMYENVDDKLQTVEEACAFVCDIKQPKETVKANETLIQTNYQNGTTKTETIKQTTANGASSIVVMICLALLVFIY